MESNDSPEIPDRGETSDIPGLPSGVTGGLVHTFKIAGRTQPAADKSFVQDWLSLNRRTMRIERNFSVFLNENFNSR